MLAAAGPAVLDDLQGLADEVDVPASDAILGLGVPDVRMGVMDEVQGPRFVRHGIDSLMGARRCRVRPGATYPDRRS